MAFQEAVKTFLDRADWLGEDEKPATVALEQMAVALDKRLTAAMVTQYNQTFRYLRGLRPAVIDDGDEIDDILGDE